MEIEKKRMLFFGSLLGLAIIGSLVMFFWGNVINRGTLKIIGDAPFNVEIIGLSKTDCSTSPCSIKTKSGYHDLLISKDGHQPIITSTTLKLWRTTDFQVQFQVVPHVAKIESIPDPDEKIDYELVMDSKTNMQKLVRKGQTFSETNFPKPITKSLIIGGKNSALIIDLNSRENAAYIVNLNTKSRTLINEADLFQIQDGSWSNDGSFLVFNKKDSSGLWLLNVATKSILPLTLATNLKQISWSYNNDLVFVTEQSYSSVNAVEINLLAEKSTVGLTFGLYKPTANVYLKIGSFPEVMSLPDEFITTANGDTIYFRSGEENFRIILRKF